MKNMKKTKETLRLTLITGIILAFLSFGMTVTASAACPLTGLLFGGSNSLFGGNSLSSLFGGGGSSCPITSIFGNSTAGSNNSSCPAASVFGNNTAGTNNSSCPVTNIFGNNTSACQTGNCSGGSTCTTGTCVNNTAVNNNCVNGSCLINCTSCTDCSQCPECPQCETANCVNGSCLTNCTTCTDCSDCPDCPQCETGQSDIPAGNVFELNKGYTYSLKVSGGGAKKNLTVKSSDTSVASASLRGTYINGAAVVYLKANKEGNAVITVCSAVNSSVCETIYVKVVDNSQTNTVVPPAQSSPSYAEEVLKYVNEARAANGLSLLRLDQTLSAAAEVRAKEINTKFSHTRPDGTSCFTVLREFGISYRVCGENIALGFSDAKSVVNAWMNSSTHRANILNPNYTSMGLGKNGTGWGQLFTA